MSALRFFLEIIMPRQQTNREWVSASFAEMQRQEVLDRRRYEAQQRIDEASYRLFTSRPRVRNLQEIQSQFVEYVTAHDMAVGIHIPKMWPMAEPTRLSEWMNIDGEYTPIKELTLSELKDAIKIVRHDGPCGGQRSKIISLEKELVSRTANKRRITERFKKTYPAKKGKKR